MEALAIGIVSSIVGAAVFAIVSGLFATRFKKQLIAVVSTLLGTGVEAVYESENEAAADLVSYARRSQSVWMLGMRAYGLLEEKGPLHFLLQPDRPAGRTVRILMSDPDSASVDVRARELNALDPIFNRDHLRAHIAESVRMLGGVAKRNHQLSVRLIKEFSAFGIMLTDEAAFVSFRLPDKFRSQGPQYRINRSSPLYRGFRRHFELVWEAAKPANGEEHQREE